MLRSYAKLEIFECSSAWLLEIFIGNVIPGVKVLPVRMQMTSLTIGLSQSQQGTARSASCPHVCGEDLRERLL